jgi:hypothetical protein
MVDTNTLLSGTGFTLGFIQMYFQMNTPTVDPTRKNFIILALITSFIWLVYHYRQNGMNITTAYTSVGIAVNICILARILKEENQRTRE